MKYSYCLILASLAASTPTQAILQGYWNMNSNANIGKLDANQGEQAATVAASFVEITAGFIGEIEPDVSGTTENLIPPTIGFNRAVGFFRAGSVYYDGAFEMFNFDFSDLSEVSVSFAYRGEKFFTWDSNLDVNYRIDGGDWENIAEGITYSSDWNVATIDMSVVDGFDNVDFQIRTTNWASIAGFLDIDNVQVNAIPEPSTYALMASVSALGLLAFRRRR
ncbi:PEP-CTERM sorting domain-containing protein [Cerasicoccus frondis]|uniref:PEP-CTERM sorting domain-containing protein n=1 Tax=Cerasicoccus frondis TaxID=490090 RepID=UPI002852868C|nr:PEP-CTERM sorting domain-containing protein [Cerasicoccus frondis]